MDALAFAVGAPLSLRHRHAWQRSYKRHASLFGGTGIDAKHDDGAANYCELQTPMREARHQSPSHATRPLITSPRSSVTTTTTTATSSSTATSNSTVAANHPSVSDSGHLNERVGGNGWQRGRRGRLTLSDVQADAIARGGTLLSAHYVNAHTPLRWRCALGHEWTASASNIRGARSWCPHCARVSRRNTIEDMNALARRYGGACLSTVYVSEHVKLLWKCSQGHTFWMAANNINRPPDGARKPSWCKICNKIRRSSKSSGSSSDHRKSQAPSTYEPHSHSDLSNPLSPAPPISHPEDLDAAVPTNHDVFLPAS